MQNENFGPWITSQAQNHNGGATQASPANSQSHSLQNGNPGNGDGYPRALPPLLSPHSLSGGNSNNHAGSDDEVLYSGTFYPYADEGLPAFPGQELSMIGGMQNDYRIDTEGTDPAVRSAIFRGLNLDTHLRLNHGDEPHGGGWESPGFL